MKRILIFCAALLFYVAYGFGRNPGDIISQTRPAEAFNAVSVNDGIDVSFTQSPRYAINVKTTEQWMPYIITEVRDGVLHINREQRKTKELKSDKATVYISAPALNAVTAKDAALFGTIGVVESGNLRLDAGSAADIEGEFNCASVTLRSSSAASVDISVGSAALHADASSGGSIRIAGKGGTIDVSTSSGAKTDALEFLCDHVTVKASSGSVVKVYAVKSLDAKATSGARVKYGGSPAELTKTTHSGGVVKAME